MLMPSNDGFNYVKKANLVHTCYGICVKETKRTRLNILG